MLDKGIHDEELGCHADAAELLGRAGGFVEAEPFRACDKHEGTLLWILQDIHRTGIEAALFGKA